MSIDEILEDPTLRMLDDEWRFMCFQRAMEAKQRAIDDMND